MQPNQITPQVSFQQSAIGGGNYRPPNTAISAAELARAQKVVDLIVGLYRQKVVGQDNLMIALLVGVFANGHILLESVPGLAKTTAAKTLAEATKASFSRIQCTPDVLPSDIIGTQIYNYTNGKFETQLGPVYANVVLLDEINRSSAKTQSAMLEAMQERQVTIGGKIHALPHPFIVLATQNPIEQEGTYQLPEAQMDRFLLKEIVAYPTVDDELQMLEKIEAGVIDREFDDKTTVSVDEVLYVQGLVSKVYVSDAMKRYMVAIINATRNPSAFIQPELAKYIEFGASPRGTITLMKVARVLALLDGRDYVTPDDVKRMRHSVLRHRLLLNFEAISDEVHPEAIIDAIFAAIPTP